jgi:hypothetical protein
LVIPQVFCLHSSAPGTGASSKLPAPPASTHSRSSRTINILWIRQINPQYPSAHKREDNDIISDLYRSEMRRDLELELDLFDMENWGELGEVMRKPAGVE